jgi:hypothetical protein
LQYDNESEDEEYEKKNFVEKVIKQEFQSYGENDKMFKNFGEDRFED